MSTFADGQFTLLTFADWYFSIPYTSIKTLSVGISYQDSSHDCKHSMLNLLAGAVDFDYTNTGLASEGQWIAVDTMKK